MLLSLSTPFIKRPVLTTVCSILIVLVGLISMALLPLDKLPEIAPKKVVVAANYIGADAKTTTDNVTTVLEREINGTESVRWIESFTDNTGNVAINVIFPTEMDRNIAQVLVQNQVTVAQADVPDSVKNAGIKTQKQSPSVTLAYALYSDKDEKGDFLYDNVFLYNYADRYIWNEIKRIKGVGDIKLLGAAKYAMRIWLDPDKLAARGLTSVDVVNTLNEQNTEVGGGRIGQRPTLPDQQFEISLGVQGRFTTPEEAENLVLKVGEDGTLIRIKDVGRAELGIENYDTQVLADDAPGVAMIIYQLPGTNALETATLIKAKLAELEKSFPPGYKSWIALDNTLFVNAALKDLSVTLAQAIALVVLIIFVFLQDWRTTVIPAIAIPVALVGAMIALLVLGFSLNQLTLFACVLATGLVVDDGIVIVEAVSTKMSEGMRPLQAALDSMEELVGATISTSAVLLAVFIPVSFFPGATGVVYKQFALTIAFAIVFSTFNALTFSPTMSAVLLRPPEKTRGPLGIFFAWFDKVFGILKGGYRRLIEFLTHIKILVMVIFMAGLVLTGWMYQVIPQGFIPAEDQGYFFVINEAPPGVSLDYTHNIDKQIARELLSHPEVEHAMPLTGFSFDGQNSNKSITFVKLKPWQEREGEKQSVYGLINRLNQTFRKEITGSRAFVSNAPAVDGLSNFAGLEIYIQDRQLKGMPALIDNAKRVMAAANKRPEIDQVITTFTFDSPQIQIAIDRNKAKAQNVEIREILNTLQTYIGSSFVNRFVLDGRLYRVYAQAEGALRANPKDINRLYIRSRDGAVIQLSNLLDLTETTYPPILTNYQVYPAIKLLAAPAPGYSSGQVIATMEEVSNEVLQPGFDYEWINTAVDEKAAGGAAPVLLGFGFVMVFLVLAAQYESYVDPTIILLTVPLAALGALGGIWLRATFIQGNASIWPILNNNIYVQVGLVMLIGMAAKNAILIVEFANQARALGMGITQAAIYAAEQRFRPILMTAISSLVGFFPLVIASGAGAVSRWSLGTAVFGGMLVATALSLLFVPNLYIVIKSFEEYFLKGGTPPKSGKPDSSTRASKSSERQGEKEEEESITYFKESPQNE
jgi:hydrophobe/amphiphile efflux-1 (HAE1) family protein